MKKTICIFLALTMLGSIAVSAFAEDEFYYRDNENYVNVKTPYDNVTKDGNEYTVKDGAVIKCEDEGWAGVNIQGDVIIHVNSDIEAYHGISAFDGAHANIKGNITAGDGEGIYADSSKVDMTGTIASDNYGIYAENGSKIYVTGDINSEKTAVFSMASAVDINGDVSGEHYSVLAVSSEVNIDGDCAGTVSSLNGSTVSIAGDVTGDAVSENANLCIEGAVGGYVFSFDDSDSEILLGNLNAEEPSVVYVMSSDEKGVTYHSDNGKFYDLTVIGEDEDAVEEETERSSAPEKITFSFLVGFVNDIWDKITGNTEKVEGEKTASGKQYYKTAYDYDASAFAITLKGTGDRIATISGTGSARIVDNKDGSFTIYTTNGGLQNLDVSFTDEPLDNGDKPTEETDPSTEKQETASANQAYSYSPINAVNVKGCKILKTEDNTLTLQIVAYDGNGKPVSGENLKEFTKKLMKDLKIKYDGKILDKESYLIFQDKDGNLEVLISRGLAVNAENISLILLSNVYGEIKIM